MNHSAHTLTEHLHLAMEKGYLSTYYEGIHADMQNAIGLILSTLRKSKNLTQNYLSSKVFCSASVISGIERGASFRHMDVAVSICHYFRIMPSRLLESAQLYCLIRHYGEEKLAHILSETLIAQRLADPFNKRSLFTEELKLIRTHAAGYLN